MEINGKVIAILTPITGESKKNAGETWKSQSFVIETQDQYPRHVVFELFGAERIEKNLPNVGDEVAVKFDLDAREWNGRWFLSAKAYHVGKAEVSQSAQEQPAVQAPMAPPPTPDNGLFPPAGEGQQQDDLPF